MKLRVHVLCRRAMPFSAVLLCLALVSQPAPAQTSTPATTNTASPASPEAAPTQPEIPRSIFVVPTSPNEGRDPFFPNTTRLFGAATTTPDTRTNLPPPVVVDLTLKGISGTREKPLAIINNQTFAVGEEGVVVSGNQRMRIRCVEIDVSAEKVIVQFGNERRELRLQQRK